MKIFLELLGGGVALYFGAEWLVTGGVAIARRLGVPSLIVGLTLVAFATSAPELVVSTQAAWEGLGDVAIGNVVGSNICNIALILGVSALITPIRVNPQILRFDWPVMFGSSVVFAAIGLMSGGFNRATGALFLAGLAAYMAWSIAAARRDRVRAAGAEAELAEATGGKTPGVAASLVLAAAGTLMLVAGGKFFVSGAVGLGRVCGVGEAVIALTVVALGTSLPELATSVIAAFKKEQDIALGNVIGSNLFNILCIIGIAPLVSPIRSAGVRWPDWTMMLATALLLYPFMRSGRVISRGEGLFFLILYAGYIVYLGVR